MCDLKIIFLLLITLGVPAGSYATTVHAVTDLTKGERLIYRRQYDEAYRYFEHGAGDEVTPEVRDKREAMLNYLKLVLYAQHNLLAHQQGSHVTFHYQTSLVSPDEIAFLTKRYDHFYAHVNKKLDITFTQPIHIFLYPERMEIPLWESLRLLSLYNSDEVHAFYGGVDHHGQIGHEMVHIMTEHLNSFRGRSKLPAFLIEGLAECVVADPWGLGLDQWVKGFMELGVFIPVEELQADEIFRKHNQIITYEEAGSFVRYLIVQYGVEKFKLLYSRPFFYTVYGRSLETLAQEWTEVIQSVEVSRENRDLISFRIALGGLYMKPSSLAQVPWIGIETSINLERVFIQKVADDSPAQRGELHEGDEVVGINGVEIHGKNVWRIGSLLLDKSIGDRVNFAVKREGKVLHREITLGVNPHRAVQ